MSTNRAYLTWGDTVQNTGHPILDGMAAAERRHERKQRAKHKEHEAGDDRHVIAGDRKHVGEARYVHGLVHRRRDGVAFAGDQRRRDRSFVAGQDPRMRLSMVSLMPSMAVA